MAEESIPAIFVISLKHSKDRRASIQKQMDKLQIPFEFHDAFDGRSLVKGDIRIDWKEVEKYPFWLSNGVLGAALSHYYVYEKIVQRQLPLAVILEDDCILNRDFIEVLKRLSLHLKGNEVLLLYYGCWNPLVFLKSTLFPLTDKYSIVVSQSMEGVITANAYAISFEAARSMFEKVLPIRAGADPWKYFMNNGMIDEIRFVYPMCCDSGDFKSTIDYLKQKSLTEKFSSLINEYKIFPFYQFLRQKRNRFKNKLHRIELR